MVVQKQLKSSGNPFNKDIFEDITSVCQFETDASGDPESASLVDLRDLGTTMTKANLPSSLGGANLDFEDWTRPDGFPDNWTVAGVDQPNVGAFSKNVLTPHSGDACLEYNADGILEFKSNWLSCRPGNLYKYSFWHNPTSITSIWEWAKSPIRSRILHYLEWLNTWDMVQGEHSCDDTCWGFLCSI